MSLTLILTRHAKSSWTDETLDDFDRPLNERGRRSAAAIGLWLVDHHFVPGDIIVSGARRTVDTWAQMSMNVPEAGDMRSNMALYEGTAETLFAVLQNASAPTTMIIGHNPTIASFARRMVAEPPNHPRFYDYPTCATSVIRMSVPSWGDIDWGKGELVDFILPRDLTV